MNQFINPKSFGAQGDGRADDTNALQAAIDFAAETGRTVYFQPGVYLTRPLVVKPHVCLTTHATWAYGRPGRVVLSPYTDDQDCVLDLAHANGATIEGLSLVGNRRGSGMCGILMRKKEFGPGEDAFRIEKCMVVGFSGHGVFLDHVWCFSVRSCMFGMNGGDGLRMYGWDAFIMDNWFSGNGGAGFGTEGPNSSVTMTANRIEWNARGGIMLEGGSHYNITGNYVDRSGGPAISLSPATNHHGGLNQDYKAYCYNISITGNVMYRSGRSAETDGESCHIRLDTCLGCSVTGNTMCIGRDDGWVGRHSPDYGMILHRSADTVVANNTLFLGALKELILDKGNHGPGFVVENNPGTIVPPSAWQEGAKHPLSIPHMAEEGEDKWYTDLFQNS